MSRSNQTELINPAVRFFDWRGGEGTVSYFDKSLGDKGENVTVKLPFKFLVLDKVSQVTGGIDRNGSYDGFWSNAVRNTKTQPLIVRSKAGVEIQGLYEHIKGHPGVKFMQGLYIAFYDESGLLNTGYLKIKGAALTAWIEFCKAHRNIYEGAFGIEGKNQQKKGSTTYYEPVFKHYPKVSEEADNVAKMLDVQLQEYLTAYFAQQGQPEVAMAVAAGGELYDHEPPMPEMTGLDEAPDYIDDSVPF